MQSIQSLIASAIREDVGDGDHTSLACIPTDATGTAQLLVKDTGVLAGVARAQEVCALVDPSLELSIQIEDGTSIKPGDIVFTVSGRSQSILQAERLSLNIMQRMSGIASLTARYVEQCRGTKAVVLDTRKTTPNFRLFEKEAVRIGGGENHRMGLYDMVMIKDNHIDFAGGVRAALEQTQAYLTRINKPLKVEIEARGMHEVEEILSVGIAHRIMLDNFTPEETKQAVNLINGRMETESSGGITLDTIRSYALCGVDYISTGAIIHSAPNFDLSLKAI